MPRSRRIAVAAGIVALAWGAAASATGADDKQACIHAHELAQQYRNGDKLKAAREQLDVCGRAVCPPLVRSDCQQLMTDVVAAIPTVVFAARDDGGRDLVEVRVRVDDTVVAERIDGKSVALDPGVHQLHFEYRGAASDQQVVIRRGEHDRIVAVTFSAGGGAGTGAVGSTQATSTSAASSGPPPADEAPPASGGGVPVLAPILAGVGVVALGAALWLDLDTTSRIHDLRNSGCAPNCDQGTVDGLQARYPIAAVIAGAGVVALGAAAWIFFSRPSKTAPTAGAALRVRPAPAGGVAELRVTF